MGSHALIKGPWSVIKGNFEQLCDCAVISFIKSMADYNYIPASHTTWYPVLAAFCYQKIELQLAFNPRVIHPSYHQVKSPSPIMERARCSLHRK